MEFVISISRPGNSWNLSEGHGKSWKSNNYAWQKDVLKIEKKNNRGVRSRLYFQWKYTLTQVHILCFIMLENMLNKLLF